MGDGLAHLFSFVSFFVRSESPVSSSRPAPHLPLARTEAVKVGRRTNQGNRVKRFVTKG